jgi:hypothetical protein
MAEQTLGNMKRDELKSLMREILQELIWEMEQEMPDPDEGLELRPEIAKYLRARLADKDRRGKPFDEAMRELGLDE